MLKAASATQKQIHLVRLHEQSKKNLEQDIQNYREEAQKQRKIIYQLEKERDRYINEASDLTQRVCSFIIGDKKSFLKSLNRCFLKQHLILTSVSILFTSVFCIGSLPYGRCQGSWDADFRLQKEDCRGRYQTEAAAELVWGCTKWQELVQQKPHWVSGRLAFILVQWNEKNQK